MTILVLCVSLLEFVLLVTVFFGPAKDADNKKRRLNLITGTDRADFDADLEKPFVQRFIFPVFVAAVKFLSDILPKNKKSKVNVTERNLKMAGMRITSSEFQAIRLLITAAFAAAALIFFGVSTMDIRFKVVIALVSVLISMLLPIYFLRFKIGSRQENIRNQLPNVMDLLSVSMEAGLGFDAALIKIGERMRGPLVDEMNKVLYEIQLGKPRRDALKILSEYSSVEELKTFVSSVIQAEQLGIPIKNVFRTQAQQLRITRKQKAEEKAMKAPVKMMLPLVAFVFPVLFIILLGPTVLQVMGQFGGK